MSVFALGLVLFTKEIVLILTDEKFHEGLKVVPIVLSKKVKNIEKGTPLRRKIFI